MSPLDRARRLAIGRRPFLAAALVPALGACAPRAGEAELPVEVVVPSTDLAVGHNRLVLGVLHAPPGSPVPVPVPDAQLTMRLYYPISPEPVLRGEATPQFRYVSDKQKGLYVAQVDFHAPGSWGVEVSGLAGGQRLSTARAGFTVKAESETPAIGDPAPRSNNLTRHDVDDLRKIDSGVPPNDMHDLSIAQAVEQGKPLVILFASPGFCVTQTCAPQLGEVQKLKARYGQQANFIHVEIFKDPMSRTPFETVIEWGLLSEPWVFMVDRAGRVAAKFEGPAPFEEMEPFLQPLL